MNDNELRGQTMLFESINVGDYVAYSYDRRNNWRKLAVQKVTATMIHVDGVRYYRSDGVRVGDESAWYRVCVYPLDYKISGSTTVSDLIEQFDLLRKKESLITNIVSILVNTQSSNFDLQTLENIYSMLTKENDD